MPLKRLTIEDVNRAINDCAKVGFYAMAYARLAEDLDMIMDENERPLEEREELQMAWTKVLFAAADYIDEFERRKGGRTDAENVD